MTTLRKMPRALVPALTGLLVIISVAALAHTTPKPYPHEGDLWYDGNYYADSYFKSHAVGGFQSSNPGMELDLAISNQFFTSCTTWSDLPSFYDDCSTAGVTEPNSSTSSYGLGTYNAKAIVAGQQYQAQWRFSGGSAASTSVNHTWQEVSHTFCWWDSPNCMNGVQGGSLKSTSWTFGSTNYVSYYY
jgi:hypothetical protein